MAWIAAAGRARGERHAPAAAGLQPELNPVERVWLYLRERFLSHRVLDGCTAVLEAACDAWDALVAETGRLASLTAYPYLLRSPNFGELV